MSDIETKPPRDDAGGAVGASAAVAAPEPPGAPAPEIADLSDPRVAAMFRSWRWRVFLGTWISYFGYYFTRKSLSVAKIGMTEQLHYTNTDLGHIDTAFLFGYTIGQFVTGPLADRFGPRRVVLLGMAVSVLVGMTSGFATAVSLFAGLAVMHGLAQATGWPSLVKNMSAWYSVRERGRVMGLWSTNYSIGSLVASWLAARSVVVASEYLGAAGSWRWAYFIPAAALAIALVAFMILQRNRPEDVGLPCAEALHGESVERILDDGSAETETEGSWSVIARVMSNWVVWVMSAAYFCIKPARYAILFWGPKFIHDELKLDVEGSTLISLAFELGGPIGVIAAGYISDRVFSARRFPVCSISLALSGAALLALDELAGLGRGGAALGLFLLGFSVYGPDSLLSGVGAMDFGTRKASGTAASLINGMGSLGSLIGAGLPGWIADTYGWRYVFYTLAVFSFAAAIFLTPFWNRLPPSAEPRK